MPEFALNSNTEKLYQEIESLQEKRLEKIKWLEKSTKRDIEKIIKLYNSIENHSLLLLELEKEELQNEFNETQSIKNTSIPILVEKFQRTNTLIFDNKYVSLWKTLFKEE
jgi:hypothetical protein